MRYAELPLSAQTAYAELAEQARAFETNSALSGLTGSFQKLKRKNQEYWYFAFRDADKVRMSYVGPDDDRVRVLIARFKQARRKKPLAPAAQSAIALGCAPTAPKHFRIIKRLAEYGFFRAGGVLVGTHAFVAYGNMLGIRWSHGSATLDVDFAHAGRPERYAVHKLIVYGERPVAERTKAKKDLLQSASLAEYFEGSGQARTFNRAWRDALERGPGWRKRALEGKKALLHLAPELDKAALWKEPK